jgi:hypothetical protein
MAATITTIANNIPIVHFNNAGHAMISNTEQQAGIDIILNQMSNARCVQGSILTLFGQLINTNSSQIAIFQSADFAVTFAAYNIERQNRTHNNTHGGRIVVLQDQMDSEVYPRQDKCVQSNGTIKFHVILYPVLDKGETWTQLILDTLTTWYGTSTTINATSN